MKGLMTNIGIVVNNQAKNSEALPSYLECFSAEGIEYSLYLSQPENLDRLLLEAKEKHSILLVGGGDGTIRSAAQSCVHSTTVLGVLPLGTLNHFSQELGLPSNPLELSHAIKQNKTKTIDVAEVNGFVFVNNSSIGFYPYFAKKRDYYTRFYHKWLSYIPGFIQALQYHPSFDLVIKNEGLKHKLRTSFLMISNNLYSYEFPLKFVRENFNQSLMGIYFFKHGKLKLSKLIRYFFKRRTSFEVKQAVKPIEVTFHGVEIDVSLDGEVIKMQNPLRYQSLPLALTVLVRAHEINTDI